MSRSTFVLVCACVTAACGTDPTGPERPTSPIRIAIHSEAGEPIGGGQSYEYTKANSAILVRSENNILYVSVVGDRSWGGLFKTSGAYAGGRLEPGTYSSVDKYPPVADWTNASMEWHSTQCDREDYVASFTIDSLTYAAGVLKAIDLRFEQRCTIDGPALRGSIHWTSNDTTRPPGPVNPPADLWQPPVGATPASGNYVYLENRPSVGELQAFLYTPVNSTIAVTPGGSYLKITVDSWTGEFRTMSSLDRLQEGYYGGLLQYGAHNPAKGGLKWVTGCTAPLGWFVIDRVVYVNNRLKGFDLRFQQTCPNAVWNGAIRWDA